MSEPKEVYISESVWLESIKHTRELDQENKELREQLRESVTQVMVLESQVQHFDAWRNQLTASVERIDQAGEQMGMRIAGLEALLGDILPFIVATGDPKGLVDRIQEALNAR